MSSRNILNLVLLVIVLGLVAIVAYEPGKEKPVTPPTLTQLKAKDVNNIKISRQSDQRDIELSRTAHGWVMLKPYHLPANTFRIDSIFKLLSTVSFSQNDLHKLDPINFGLDKPYATITLNNKTSIIFGHNKSLQHLRYVQIGSVLHMIADTFYYQLAAKAESFIDHQLIPKQRKITQLQLPGLKLEEKEEKWEVTPKPKHFSMDSVNDLISEWQLSQAYDIGYEKNKINAKAGAATDIRITLDNQAVIRFNIVKDPDGFALLNIDTGVKYILAKDRKDKLLKLSEPESSDKQ